MSMTHATIERNAAMQEMKKLHKKAHSMEKELEQVYLSKYLLNGKGTGSGMFAKGTVCLTSYHKNMLKDLQVYVGMISQISTSCRRDIFCQLQQCHLCIDILRSVTLCCIMCCLSIFTLL